MSTALFDVAGKNVVVTGATSGLGLMIATGLVAAGARVLVSSRRPEAVAEVTAALSEQTGQGSCVGVPADVGRREGAERIAEAVAEHFDGRLHGLVNNAGATWGARLAEFPDDAWRKLGDLNLLGPFRLTVALLGALRSTASAADPSRVVNIGSIAGLRPTDVENYAYSATKAGVHMLSRQLAARLAPDHITVNALAPGYFPSKMSAYALADDRMREALLSAIPLRRFGEPEDIVGAVQFLLSRAGAYVNATVIELDGGAVGAA